MTDKKTLWVIVLVLLGSPVWLSLIIAAVAVVLSVYASLWSFIVSLWAVFGSFIACSFGGMVSGIILISLGNTYSGLGLIASGILLAGLSIFCFFGSRAATKGILLLTKKSVIWIKKCFISKEEA